MEVTPAHRAAGCSIITGTARDAASKLQGKKAKKLQSAIEAARKDPNIVARCPECDAKVRLRHGRIPEHHRPRTSSVRCRMSNKELPSQHMDAAIAAAAQEGARALRKTRRRPQRVSPLMEFDERRAYVRTNGPAIGKRS